QLARIGQWLDRAAARIDPAAEIFLRADEMADVVGAEFARAAHAATGPLRGAVLHEIEAGFGVRPLDPSLAFTRHIHRVLVDKIKDNPGGAADKVDKATTAFRTEFLLQIVGIVFQSRNHLAAVAPRASPAGLVRLKNHDARAALGEMQRGGKARISRTD